MIENIVVKFLGKDPKILEEKLLDLVYDIEKHTNFVDNDCVERCFIIISKNKPINELFVYMWIDINGLVKAKKNQYLVDQNQCRRLFK
jgi:hypothetical protein